MPRHRRTPFTAGLLTAGALLATAAGAAEPRRQLPPGPPIEGFQQLLPRGAIAAVVEPEMVPAAEAELPGDAWVLGFEHQGQAYAYDLNILNHHEVVNHTAGDQPVAAVW